MPRPPAGPLASAPGERARRRRDGSWRLEEILVEALADVALVRDSELHRLAIVLEALLAVAHRHHEGDRIVSFAVGGIDLHCPPVTLEGLLGIPEVELGVAEGPVRRREPRVRLQHLLQEIARRRVVALAAVRREGE